MAADLAVHNAYLYPVSRRGKVRPCPRCQRRHRQILLVIGVVLGLIAGVLTAWLSRPATASSAPPATATLASYTGYVGNRILNLAETRANDWYVYGAAGPSYFDCSGLVYWAATAAGERSWPRDTYDIAAEIGSRFSITYHPQRGDLAMWGSVRWPYHVELVTIWYQTTFGAEQPTWDGRVTWHYDGWFRPSFYLHINW